MVDDINKEFDSEFIIFIHLSIKEQEVTSLGLESKKISKLSFIKMFNFDKFNLVYPQEEVDGLWV